MFREPGEAFQPINVIGVPNVDQTVLKAYKTVPIEPAGIEITSQLRLFVFSTTRSVWPGRKNPFGRSLTKAQITKAKAYRIAIDYSLSYLLETVLLCRVKLSVRAKPTCEPIDLIMLRYVFEDYHNPRLLSTNSLRTRLGQLE